MNRFEEEIITAQYADDPDDLLPPNGSSPNPGGMSVGCILSIIAACLFCLVLAVAVVGAAFVAWDSRRQSQQASNETGETLVTESLTVDNLEDAVEIFDGAERDQNAVQSHADFKGIDKLFQKVSDASDWNDAETVYPYFDFKKHAEVVRNVPETRRFFRQYSKREVDQTVRDFGVFIAPFSAWRMSEIQTLSSNERLVYAQVMLSYDTTVKRCRVWVIKSRFSGWKIYDWEEVSDLCRSSDEAAVLIAESNANYSKAFNQYYDYIETDLQEDLTDAQFESILRRCERLQVSPKIRPGVLLNIGSYWQTRGKPKQALRCVNQISNKHLIPEVYRLEGNAHEALEDYEAAIEKYELFIERVGAHSDVLQSLVGCYEKLGKTDQQQAYQLERFQAWPANTSYFDAAETVAFYKDEPETLFGAIDRSPESQKIYEELLEQLGGNPFALSEMQLVKGYLDSSDLKETLLGQKATALLALAEGDRVKFERLMIELFKRDSDTEAADKWEQAVDHGFHRELFDALEDKEAAFSQLVKVYLYGDWYGSEKSFESICDSYYAINPADKFAVYFKAYQLFQAGKFDLAMPLFESIEGRMEGDFKYLNDTVTKWRLTILLNQKQFSKALELAKQKDAVQKLLVVAVKQDATEMLSEIQATDLEESARDVLRGLQSLEKKQFKMAAGYFSKYLKLQETDYQLERLASEGLLRSQSKALPVAILKKVPTWRMYNSLEIVLTKNQNWKALESLSEKASELLKSEFEENEYAESRVRENYFKALWEQGMYDAILRKYRSLGKDVVLSDKRFVFWAAYKQNDLRLARKICEPNENEYGDDTDLALLAAFEGDMKAFETEVSKLEPYSKADLDEDLLRLRIGNRFRRALYQQAGPVDVDYPNYTLQSIDAIFPADWSLADTQVELGLSKLKKLTGQRYELTSVLDTGQGKRWIAKSESCGVMVELKRVSNGKYSGTPSSPIGHRINKLLVDDHQYFTVAVFPLAEGKENRYKSMVNYSALAAAFFVAIADESSLAVDIGNGWSDQKEAFERLTSIAKRKAFKSLVPIETFYSFSLDDNVHSAEKLSFRKELSLAWQSFQNSSETEKSLLVTVKYEDTFTESIEVELDDEFELRSYGSGATFTGTVTSESTPFGIYKVGDRLEFSDSQIDQWKLTLADEVQSGQRKSLEAKLHD